MLFTMSSITFSLHDWHKICEAFHFTTEEIFDFLNHIETTQLYTNSLMENTNIVVNESQDGDINCSDINAFSYTRRCDNNRNNKIRENIIAHIINKKIPLRYYEDAVNGEKWQNLKNELDVFLQTLCQDKKIDMIRDISCKMKGGRKHNYDFNIIINEEIFNVEFKFNASRVRQTPEFASPMKPSQYLNMSFEEYFYDNYLFKIAEYGNLEMPSREEYLRRIHNNKVKCMKYFKEQYDLRGEFNEYCGKIDKEAIKNFIQISNINIDTLSEYLLESQKNKVYMCYRDGKFYYDRMDTSIYKIENLIRRENTNWICQSQNGMKLEIKLRFKNGCGLQFPAFQIKRKIPPKSELKSICKQHLPTETPIRKEDMLALLDHFNIIY